MALEIGRNGIVQRHEDGSVTVLRPGRNGGAGTEIAVPPDLADAFRLATGDVVEGDTEPIEDGAGAEPESCPEMVSGWDVQV